MCRIGVSLVAALAAACAAPVQQPAQSLNLVYDQSHSVAVRERISRVEQSSADFCVVVAVNGKKIRNSIDATRDASSNMGRVLSIKPIEQSLEPVAQRLTIACKTVHSAPIASLFGGSDSIEGDVEFTPKGRGPYVVTGTLGTPERGVWIEDAVTGEVVTTRVAASKP
jgi:hypothetical protein